MNVFFHSSTILTLYFSPILVDVTRAHAIKRFIRNNKTDPYVDQVELLNSNLTNANIKYPNGRESLFMI